MFSRRQVLTTSAAMLGAGLVSRAEAAGLPEAPIRADAKTQPPLTPNSGRPYNP